MDNSVNKERFIDDGQSANVVLEPQCVDCVHNLGLMKCAMLKEKPIKYLSNEKDCPERTVEG
jgi:hypothetical protein